MSNFKLAKLICCVLYLFLWEQAVFGQNSLQTFNENRIKSSTRGMYILGSWSIANITYGTFGALTASGEAKYFHQMNAGWNAVNLVIAGFGLYQSRNEKPADYNFQETLLKQQKLENAFLFNSALNFTYITAGFLLKERSKNDLENYHRWQGFGNSLIFQGGFLLGFDAINFFIQRKRFTKDLMPMIDEIQLSQAGLGLKWNIGK